MSIVTRNEVLTKKEAARLLDIGLETTVKWCRAGWLERVIIGNRWYITVRSVRSIMGKPVKVSTPGPYLEHNKALVREAGCPAEFPRKSVVGEY